MNNAVPICRSVEDHWVFGDADYFKLWYVILSRAQYKIKPTRGVFAGVMYTQSRGEFIFGRREWARRYNIGENKIRKFIELLEADEMIVRTNRTQHFSIYRVLNYDKFNPLKTGVDIDTIEEQEPIENPLKNQGSNPLTTTIKKVKKVRTSLVEEIHLRLAGLLREHIAAWKPNAKIPKDLHGWADDVRLCMTQDGRTEQEMEAVICWATADSFWRVNILSPDALRRNFDKLQAKMMQAKPTQQATRDYSSVRM